MIQFFNQIEAYTLKLALKQRFFWGKNQNIDFESRGHQNEAILKLRALIKFDPNE